MDFIRRHAEVLTITALLAVSVLAHGINMFQFPYFENDEMVYVSQAWSLTELGELAPYTYWYDHAPAGWMLIGAWAKLTGGYFTFGPAVNSGRVLMLLLHAASALLLYFIAKRLSGSRISASIAVLVFSLSPLGIHFQRRVLLDNIMVFWTLASAAALLIPKLRLRHVVLSAACLAIGILSKESAVFFVPAFLYLVYRVSHKNNRVFTIISWLAVSGALISLYPLYALIQSEFFQYGTSLGGTTPHVSLLETLKFQGSRPGGSIFYPPESLFWQNMHKWIAGDWFVIIGGVLSTAILLCYSLIRRRSLIGFVALLNAFALLFLMRGGVVIEFYVVPLIPLFALAIGLVLGGSIEFIRNRFSHIGAGLAVIVLTTITLGYLVFGNTFQSFNIYTANQVEPQLLALDWIRENASADDYIITDNYLWLDLNAPENPSGKVFKNAEWYWKVERDPTVRKEVFNDSTETVDYVLQTPQVIIDTQTSDFKFIAKTLDESRPIVSFDRDNWSVIIWGNLTVDKVMKRSWTDFKQNFVSEGKVSDPERPGVYTSQAQSYTLLRAVWMNDKKTFDETWQWTKANLQNENGTFAGVINAEGTGLSTFTDADQDIALALIFASNQWENGAYAYEARRVLDGIWNYEVVYYDETPYISAGNWSKNQNGTTLNPSYLSPASYRIFAEFDPAHPWMETVDSSYRVLRACTTSAWGTGVLPSDWCQLNTETGSFGPSQAPQPSSIDYSVDAMRVPFRVALDYQWFASPESVEYLTELDFLEAEYQREGKLYASYQHSGEVRERYESVATYAGSLGYFIVTNPKRAKEIYEERIATQFYENAERSYWQDENNLYTQNWAWFGTALYGNRLPNLFEKI